MLIFIKQTKKRLFIGVINSDRIFMNFDNEGN